MIVYAPDPERIRWIDDELAGAGAVVQLARSVDQVVSALVDDPPPRPQVLVIDLDALTPVELIRLHTVREQGWCGKLVAFGRVPLALRRSLAVGRVVTPVFDDGVLREEVVRHQTATQQSTAALAIIRQP